VKRDRFFTIFPDGAGSGIVVASLPRIKSMGFSATVDSKDFFEIVSMVEATL
jgi:hypothetical protein